jgi:hypothetical protein
MRCNKRERRRMENNKIISWSRNQKRWSLKWKRKIRIKIKIGVVVWRKRLYLTSGFSFFADSNHEECHCHYQSLIFNLSSFLHINHFLKWQRSKHLKQILFLRDSTSDSGSSWKIQINKFVQFFEEWIVIKAFSKSNRFIQSLEKTKNDS